MWKLLVCAAFASVVPAATVLGQGPVHFADAALKAAVEEELGVTDPNSSDMLRLGGLSAPERRIGSIVGLEHATNLRYLYLVYNRIGDISPLAGLMTLQGLHLEHNQIRNISALSGLGNLNSLTLWDNQIED